MPTSSSRRSMRRLSALALSVVLPLTLGGCALELLREDEPDAGPSRSLTPSPLPSSPASDSAPEPAPGDPEPAALQTFYQQDVAWKSCRDGLRCATIKVPLDYAEPDGESITLSLLKVPAGSGAKRVGSLVVNPGGPGGSGVDFAAQAEGYFGPDVVRAFDVVGFDPRGVGESSPVQCLSDRELDTYVATDPDPDSPAEVAEADRLLVELGQGCVEESGELASHMSTVEAAKDIDIIRAVLGDRKLSYFGASYGTFLGATYAELFPQRVGRMVLDGAIDPSLSNEEMSLVQARGFEVALRAYVGACVDDGDCFLGDTVDKGTKRIRAFLDRVEKQPIKGTGDRKLEVGNAVLGIWAPLYNEGYWPMLDQALKSAFDGNGAILLSLSDQYTSRGPRGYTDNSLEALYAVNCLDQEDPIPSSEVEALIPKFEKASPTFGAIFAYSLASCAQWPVTGVERPETIDAAGAAPIVVIGTSRDPATPLVWAESLADQLASGVLVRRDGDGHTGYNNGNACVDRIVDAYLVTGKVPKDGAEC